MVRYDDRTIKLTSAELRPESVKNANVFAKNNGYSAVRPVLASPKCVRDLKI